MKTIRGKYSEAKVFTELIDDLAAEQLLKLCNQPFTTGSVIRVMPDVHPGAGCTIGTTMTITDRIVPNLVGVDIGCGMETVRLREKSVDFRDFDRFVRSEIPSGFAIRRSPHPYNEEIDLKDLRAKSHVSLDRAILSIGTLGGGNHFIELDRDDDNNLYLVVHSGSRHLGLEIATVYQNKAWDYLKKRGMTDIPKDLAFLEGHLFESYMHDMKIAQRFAALNRQAMVDAILTGLGLSAAERFTTVHNYIDTDSMILRKGAVSAQKGEKLLVPINMRDGSLICTGKGNSDWNWSAPHGAGRLFSRKEAIRRFSVNEFTTTMAGVWSSTVGKETLDECPMAYKPASAIEETIVDTAAIETRIHPVYNFKATGD